MAELKMFAMRMPVDVREALARASLHSGKNVTALILEAIDLYLSQYDEQSDEQIDKVCAATKANVDLTGMKRSSILDALRDEGVIG